MRVGGLIKHIGRCDVRASSGSGRSLTGSGKVGFEPEQAFIRRLLFANPGFPLGGSRLELVALAEGLFIPTIESRNRM